MSTNRVPRPDGPPCRVNIVSLSIFSVFVSVAVPNVGENACKTTDVLLSAILVAMSSSRRENRTNENGNGSRIANAHLAWCAINSQGDEMKWRRDHEMHATACYRTDISKKAKVGLRDLAFWRRRRSSRNLPFLTCLCASCRFSAGVKLGSDVMLLRLKFKFIMELRATWVAAAVN